MKRVAVYPGTFDPFTRGHYDIVKRALLIFDEVIIAIATSARKTPLFNFEDRLAMCEKVFVNDSRIKVLGFNNLLVDFVQQQQASFIVKGLRGVADFDYELQMAGINRQMAPGLETVFLVTDEKYAYISGTMVREILSLGGDVAPFVPEAIQDIIRRK